MSSNSTRSGSFRRVIVQRKDEKWWLPVPCVPKVGLSDKSKKHLRHKRDCAYQIHKAAMAINSSVLAEMEIPDSYMATLPKVSHFHDPFHIYKSYSVISQKIMELISFKFLVFQSGKSSLGDSIYRYLCSPDKFSPDYLLDCLNIASEHEALQLADRVEASMYTWRRKACISHSKSSWDMVKDLMSDTDRIDKNHFLAGRAESLLFCLKQRYPELSQTSLDTCKIQYNRVSIKSHVHYVVKPANHVIFHFLDTLCCQR